MNAVGFWFLFAVVSAVLAWRFGAQSGRHSLSRARLVASIAFGLLIAWVFFLRRPEMLLAAMPASVLSVMESFVATPLMLMMLGVLWVRSRFCRQRVVVTAGILLGVLYMIHGSAWMLQTTPSVGFAQTHQSAVQKQSQAYSCVPAACATAMNRWGVNTTEQEMAEMTQTRRGTGATVVRAVAGINRKLSATDLVATVVNPSHEELLALPMPALTAVKAGMSNLHMVTILRVDERNLVVADPTGGRSLIWSWSEYEARATGLVIVFGPR